MEFVKGDLLEAKEKVIAHGCNCQGVMGSGVAKAIRAKWPEAYTKYRETFEKVGLELGDVVSVPVAPNKWVANVMTQNLYGTSRRMVNYAAIAYGIRDMIEMHFAVGRFALPKIGAGLGGGDWNIIEAILRDIETIYSVEFVIYEI